MEHLERDGGEKRSCAWCTEERSCVQCTEELAGGDVGALGERACGALLAGAQEDGVAHYEVDAFQGTDGHHSVELGLHLGDQRGLV